MVLRHTQWGQGGKFTLLQLCYSFSLDKQKPSFSVLSIPHHSQTIKLISSLNKRSLLNWFLCQYFQALCWSCSQSQRCQLTKQKMLFTSFAINWANSLDTSSSLGLIFSKIIQFVCSFQIGKNYTNFFEFNSFRAMNILEFMSFYTEIQGDNFSGVESP